MLAVDYPARPAFTPGVMTASPRLPPRAKQIGAALRAMRKAAGLSQDDAAKRANTFQQSWQRYESGATKAALNLDKLEELARAVGSSAEAVLALAEDMAADGGRARPTTDHPQDRLRPYEIGVYGRAQAGALGQHVVATSEPTRTVDIRTIFGRRPKFTTIAGESMIPWGYPGQVIAYDEDATFVRRDQPCVIITKSGDVLVKLFGKIADGVLEVEELNPVRRTMRLSLEDIGAVFAVTGKIE